MIENFTRPIKGTRIGKHNLRLKCETYELPEIRAIKE